MPADLTPSQTLGPFFHDAMLRDDGTNVLAGPGVEGELVRIEGRVVDGAGDPVDDALVEVWQANRHGRYRHPADDRDLPLDPDFVGWGRSGTDGDGIFWFVTVKPGGVPHPDGGEQAPHLLVTVQARGLLDRLLTRLYFADEDANASDPVLSAVPADRRGTLVAARDDSGDVPTYRFDIRLQGDGETVFFAA
ncbi:MAG: protocatechuate 3,4-dioxygenase subunit alpha [Nitriliruptorales bacterium]